MPTLRPRKKDFIRGFGAQATGQRGPCSATRSGVDGMEVGATEAEKRGIPIG